jgi:hypothetical protein
MRRMPVRFGMGFGLPFPLLKLRLPNPDTIYWAGGGCSLIIIDMDARTTFAYTANHCQQNGADSNGRPALVPFD